MGSWESFYQSLNKVKSIHIVYGIRKSTVHWQWVYVYKVVGIVVAV